jgi:hypothetical protein
MKKQFITKKLLQENRLKSEKLIIENFAKTFNKIKRVNENNISEYDNFSYPEGADADPNAPWNQDYSDDEGLDYSGDAIKNITSIASIGGYKNPLTLDSAKNLGVDAVTNMGGEIVTNLADYINASRLNDMQKQQFINSLKNVGEEENETYNDGTDEFFIDIQNPQVQEMLLSINVRPNLLDVEYPEEQENKPDYSRDHYDGYDDSDHPDVRSKEWGGMDI